MSCTYGFFGSFLVTLFALRVLNELGLSPLALGLLAVAGGVGSFAGAGLAGPMTRRLGLGPSIIVAYFLAVLFDLSIPLAGGPALLAFLILFTGYFFSDTFYVVENISSLSLRQAVTPEAQLGRVNAVFLIANRALRPVGALAAGVLGEAIGIQETLFVGVAGVISASVWLFFSPLPRLKAAPSQPSEIPGGSEATPN
jgi:predicted MFS family arabinose efflux permease